MKLNFKHLILTVLMALPAAQSFAAEAFACAEGQILVCIPNPPCGAGTIGCREAPRPANICFCAAPPQKTNLELMNNEIDFEENFSSDL